MINFSISIENKNVYVLTIENTEYMFTTLQKLYDFMSEYIHLNYDKL